MENISEICLEIDNIVKKQNIPFETYKKINSLLCDIIRIQNKQIEEENEFLKELLE